MAEVVPIATARAQKLLANIGLASRRTIEEWLKAGRITVDGATVTLGQKISWGQQISLDGKAIVWPKQQAQAELILYHKPEGEICTRSDPAGRSTVFGALPKPKFGKWIAVGRLDINSSGLLLFTTDGNLAHKLMHPSSKLLRKYLVRVHGVNISSRVETQLKQGIQLEDGLAQFHSVKKLNQTKSHSWYEVSLYEGRYREVRRMWQYFDLTVSRLIRIAYGKAVLQPEHKPGTYKVLDYNAMVSL